MVEFVGKKWSKMESIFWIVFLASSFCLSKVFEHQECHQRQVFENFNRLNSKIKERGKVERKTSCFNNNKVSGLPHHSKLKMKKKRGKN